MPAQPCTPIVQLLCYDWATTRRPQRTLRCALALLESISSTDTVSSQESAVLSPLYAKAWACYAAAAPDVRPDSQLGTLANRLSNLSAIGCGAEEEALKQAQAWMTPTPSHDSLQTNSETPPSANLFEVAQGNGTVGRHLRARSCIDSGQVLLNELPIAAARRTENDGGKHCHWCFAEAVCGAVTPCPGCSYAVYCSRHCQRQAWVVEHQNECGCVLPLIFAAETTLAWRLHRLCMHSTSKGVVDSIGSMISHEKSLDREAQLGLAIQAAVCSAVDQLQLIRNTEADCNDPSQELIDQVASEAKDILLQLCRIRCNGIAVTAVQSGKFSKVSSQNAHTQNAFVEALHERRLAVAIYRTASLCNHSCLPSVRIMGFAGRELRLVSACSIASGDEITISYGPVAGRMALKRRQQILLKQYNFVCVCNACATEHKAVECPEDPFQTGLAADFHTSIQMLDAGDAAGAASTLQAAILRYEKAADAANIDYHGALEWHNSASRQHIAEVYDTLARSLCCLGDYIRAAAACSSAVMLLRHHVAPGEEPSLAREECKLASLCFHAAIQHGPTNEGKRAVSVAAEAVARAREAAALALPSDDSAHEEMAHMAAALAATHVQDIHDSANADHAPPGPDPCIRSTQVGDGTRDAGQTRRLAVGPEPEQLEAAAATENFDIQSSAQQCDNKSDAQPNIVDNRSDVSNAIKTLRQMVELLHGPQEPDDRLATLQTVHRMLCQCDDEIAAEFIAAGGVNAIHERLSAMDATWLAEARNGSTDLLDRIARLPAIRTHFLEVVRQDEKAIAAHKQATGCRCLDCLDDDSERGVPRRQRVNKLRAKGRPVTLRRPSAKPARGDQPISTTGAVKFL